MVHVYIDDSILASNDIQTIEETNKLLISHFQMKDMGVLRYFLDIGLDHSQQGIFLS